MADLELHCRQIGQGPDLVLLHGWGLHAGIWDSVAEPLAAHFRLHLFDLPGHGRNAPVADFTLDSLCAALAREAPEQAHWLGWSLGGMAALEFAARHPLRVARLVQVASNPRFVAGPDWPHAMQGDVLDGFARDLIEDYPGTLNRFLSLVARGSPDSDVLRTLRRSLAAAPAPAPGALRAGLSILRDADLRPRLDDLAVEMLWMGGARDTLVPIAALRGLAGQHPRMRLQEIAQAGHAPFISHPEAFITAVMEFLR